VEVKRMKYDFKPGDKVAFKETATMIGYYNLSLQREALREKTKAKYRGNRWEVLSILEGRTDKDGDPCFRLRRLDTKGHGLETWSQGFFVKVE